MFCPSCQTKNQFYNNYCYFCGEKLKDNDSILESSDNHVDKDELDTYISEDLETSPDREFLEPKPDLDDLEIGPELEDLFIDEKEKKEPSIDQYSNDTYDLFLEKNDLLGDDFFDLDKSSEFDLSTHMPLRRYQKDKSSSKGKKVFSGLLSSFVLIALAGLLIFAGIRHFSNRTPSSSNIPQLIAVSSSVEEITKDDEKAYKIVFNTVNGKEVSFLGDIKDVENGRAEFVVQEALLYTYNPELTEEGEYEVNVDAIISAPNLADSIERVTITLSPPYDYAPFKLLQPSSAETEFEGDSSKVSFEVESDSTVFINEEDHTAFVSPDGRFEKLFTLPSQHDELILNIRVSTPGYLDNIQQVILRKSVMDVPISINEQSPISSNEQWVKVSGTVHPEATIEASLEIFEEPDIDRDTGDFTSMFKLNVQDILPCTLTAKVNGLESSVEIILERETSVDTYTSTAWQPEYSQLQQNDQLSNGRHFVFRGRIKDILETGDKNVFTVSLSSQSEPEQLFYVEYWGSFDYSTGDQIRVFGNRWGNKDGIPRFLAKYIYEG